MTGLRVSAFLARRSVLRSNYGVAATTVLMLLLIYISLLFLPSLIQGAIRRVETRLVDTATSNIVITPEGHSAALQEVDGYLAKIRDTKGVRAATAVYRLGTEVTHGSASGAWSVDAVDPTSWGQVFTTPENLLEGRALRSGDTNQVLLGIGVAGADRTKARGYRASLQTVKAGDTVEITLLGGRKASFHVAGVYDNQFPQSDGDAYVSRREAAQLVPASQGAASAIYVKTRPGVPVGRVIGRLRGLRAVTLGSRPPPISARRFRIRPPPTV